MKRRLLWMALVVSTAVACSTAKYVRETTDTPYETNDELIARGAYLVNNVASCGACHSGREDGDILSPESTDLYMAGGFYVDEPAISARFYMPNITPDKETGIGSWTDDEIARAIRDGIANDGSLLNPAMQYDAYQHMSDDDVKAVVAYLRSIPAVKAPGEVPVRKKRMTAPFMMKMVMNMGVMHHEPVSNVAGPDPGDPVAQGEYIATMGHCYACHSAGKMGPRKKDDAWYAGSDMEFQLPGVGTLYASNLTPAEKTGLGKYSAEQIKEALRTGRRLDGSGMAPPMSLFVPHMTGLTDEDMDALVAYLKSLEPVEKEIPKRRLTQKYLDIVRANSSNVSDGGAKDEPAPEEKSEDAPAEDNSTDGDAGSETQ